MKRFYFFLLVSFFGLQAQAQDKVEYEIENLKNNGNPAATLLGITSDQIQIIKSPTDFTTQLKSSTKDLTQLPDQIGFEFFIYDVLNTSVKQEELFSNKVWNNIKHTFALSTALSGADEGGDAVSTAFGLRFSLARGNFEKAEQSYFSAYSLLSGIGLGTEEQEAKRSELIAKMMQYNQQIGALTNENDSLATLLTTFAPTEIEKIEEVENQMSSNTEIIKLNQDLLNYTSQEIATISVQAANSESQEVMREQLREETKTFFNELQNRDGFKLDFSAGYSWRNTDQDFQEIDDKKLGAWLVGAYSINGNGDKKLLDVLGIARYQHQPDFMVNTVEEVKANMFDFGSKLLIDRDRFYTGGELIFRHYADDIQDVDQNTSRWLFDIGYDLGKNTFISFNYGREFDGENIEGGNLIAALNFVKGFGKKREVKPQ